jgi:hypothetical protein
VVEEDFVSPIPITTTIPAKTKPAIMPQKALIALADAIGFQSAVPLWQVSGLNVDSSRKGVMVAMVTAGHS